MKLLSYYIVVLLFIASCSGSGEKNSTAEVKKDTPVEMPEQAIAEDLSDHPGLPLYKQHCLPCHQADGNGVPGMHPPLRESDWVTGDKERLVRIVMEGMEGEIEVHGETYNSVMAPLNYLEPQQVADVLTYVRNSFGNQASEVTLEEVQEVLNNL